MQYKIGDIVKIIDTKYCYGFFIDWINKYKLEIFPYCSDFFSSKQKNFHYITDEFVNSHLFKIIAIGLNPDDQNETLVALFSPSTGTIHLVEQKGIISYNLFYMLKEEFHINE